jgi:hypothetical protein
MGFLKELYISFKSIEIKRIQAFHFTGRRKEHKWDYFQIFKVYQGKF